MTTFTYFYTLYEKREYINWHNFAKHTYHCIIEYRSSLWYSSYSSLNSVLIQVQKTCLFGTCLFYVESDDKKAKIFQQHILL